MPSPNGSLTVGDHDLPGLFASADQTSLAAQKLSLRLIRAELGLIVAAAFVTSWAVSSASRRSLLATAGAALFVAGLGLRTFLLQSKPDKQWFGGRAVAESVKTIAWRYMTGADPYPQTLTDQRADELLCREFEAILRERAAAGASLGGPDASRDQITARMREVRKEDLQSRKEIYLRCRIRDQRSWYAAKATANARASNVWGGTVAGAQLLGALAALALIRWPNFQLNLAGLLAAAAGALLAWLQVKQHGEISQAYALAAHELGLVEARSPHVASEEDFSAFVGDAENAISREHTMWVARRDVIV